MNMSEKLNIYRFESLTKKFRVDFSGCVYYFFDFFCIGASTTKSFKGQEFSGMGCHRLRDHYKDTYKIIYRLNKKDLQLLNTFFVPMFVLVKLN